MRERIEREHPAASPWDVKYLRGGLVDIEFIAQYLQLRHAADVPEVVHASTRRALRALADHALLDAADADVLSSALKLWQEVQGMLRLTVDGAHQVDAEMPQALKQALARTTGEADFSRLTVRMQDTARAVQEIYGRIIGMPAN
jgi:glutamate-ammonia-ligase adenylyltransferase